mgnify:CR=1 FL=1
MDYQTYVEVDDDEIIDYVGRNMRPEDVFDDDQLREWALYNGFVEEAQSWVIITLI